MESLNFADGTSLNSQQIEALYESFLLPVNIIGTDTNDNLIGNYLNNVIDGRLGADTMAGGLGDDTYIVDNVGDVVTEVSGEGTDTVVSNITYTLVQILRTCLY